MGNYGENYNFNKEETMNDIIEKRTVKQNTSKRAAIWTCIGTTAMVDGMNIVVSIIAAVIILVYLLLMGTDQSGFGKELTNMLLKHSYSLTAGYMIAAFGLLILILKIRKKNIIQIINIKKVQLPFGYVYILFIPLAYTLSLFTNHIMDLMSKYMAMPGLETAKAISNLNNDPLWYKFIIIALIAPFFEEFVFRGLIYSKLKEACSLWFVIVFQAFLFGVYHMNLVQGVYAMVLGVVFGYFVYLYDNLWPSIIMHITINGFSVVMAHLYIEQIEVVTPVSKNIMFIAGGLVGFIVFAMIVIVIEKKTKRVFDQ